MYPIFYRQIKRHMSKPADGCRDGEYYFSEPRRSYFQQFFLFFLIVFFDLENKGPEFLLKRIIKNLVPGTIAQIFIKIIRSKNISKIDKKIFSKPFE